MNEIIGKQRMQIADGMAIKPDASRVVGEHFESRFVVEDHLRLFRFVPLGGLTELEQAFGFKQRVGISLKPTRIPRQVDQKALQNLSQISARRQFVRAYISKSRQFVPRFGGQVKCAIRLIRIQKIGFVSDWKALSPRSLNQITNTAPFRRKPWRIACGGVWFLSQDTR